MSKSKKIPVIIAICCIGVGLVLLFAAMGIVGFDLAKLNTMEFETNTYEVTQSFTALDIRAAECNIRLAPSTNGTCSVVCTESDKIFHTVSVQNGTLVVTRTDTRKWYDCIGIYWGEMELTVYVPESTYESLYLKSASGDVTVPSGFHFAEAEVYSTSGEVCFTGRVDGALTLKTVSGGIAARSIMAGELSVQSTSGEIEITSAEVSGAVSLKSVSGDVSMEHVDGDSLFIHTTSGDIELEDMLIAKHSELESVSGEIEFTGMDGASLWIKSVSGDVEGTLLSGKLFIAHTTSGNVRMPDPEVSAGKCEITTTSGDISISVAG